MSSHAHAGFLLWESFLWSVSTGSYGSSISWSSWYYGFASTIYVPWTLVPSSYSTSSIGILLDLENVKYSSKFTSLPISILLNPRKYIQQAFDVSLYPMNIPFLPKGSSLVLFSFGICMYTWQPNILKWMTSYFSPNISSSGLLFSSTQWEVWFYTYKFVLVVSTQRYNRRS